MRKTPRVSRPSSGILYDIEQWSVQWQQQRLGGWQA
jgi:hypothetical protein